MLLRMMPFTRQGMFTLSGSILDIYICPFKIILEVLLVSTWILNS